MRVLSAETRVGLHHLRGGMVTDDDCARIGRRLRALPTERGGLAGLLVGEAPPASGGGEGVDLPFELLAAGGDPGAPDQPDPLEHIERANVVGAHCGFLPRATARGEFRSAPYFSSRGGTSAGVKPSVRP
ncbi:hypothetical protein SVIO_003340 [Streptomyces violaceusniger]|uniref:Uncharacterized protein n=1 Tax=Streptomyces violaceusniger TaxID=68280 RepID=A0A4D4KKN6_STRVO|nr:hypothetical protein SVIO_003340 [Streptomyces violaceusniger]